MTPEEKATALDYIKKGTMALMALVPTDHIQEADAAWDDIVTGVVAIQEKV